MKFVSAALHHVVIPFHEPFRIANGAVAEKDAIVVELQTDLGIVGVGEASPMAGGFYSSETPESTWQYLCDQLVPAILAHDTLTPESAADIINQFPLEPFARAGIEGAVWDAWSREQNVPLYALLGGGYKPVPSGAAVGLCDTIDALLDRVEAQMRLGYRRMKIKIEPGWDVEPLRAIRARFGDIPLMVDANASYDLRTNRAALKTLDEFGLMMIEQPLAKEAFDDSAALQCQLRTPICADESAYSLDALNTIIDKGSARIINIKIQRVGGLHNARQIAERAMSANLPCWLGTMPELGIASRQGLHLATHAAFTYPTDVAAGSRWYPEDIVDPAITLDEGGTLLPYSYELDRNILARRTTKSRIFTR